MKEAFEAFLQDSTLDTYYALRDEVCAHPRFNPYSEELAQLNALCTERQYKEMQIRMQAMVPNCLLSPSFHLFASIAAKETGDETTAEVETLVARKFLVILLATGDGSDERPYHVLRIEDEYDLMAAHGREVKGQELVQRDGRYFDVLVDTDGRKTWFDVTVPRTYLERALGSGREFPV